MPIDQQDLLRGATAEIIDVDVEALGIHVDHLVRPIHEADVYELAEKDHSDWDPIEIRPWPQDWGKPSPSVLYHVVSGNHRTSAARLKGLQTLRAKMIEAPDEKTYLVAAIKSNTRHGRNFTREEYALNAKKLQQQGLSLTEIANILGYSKSAISRMMTGNDSHASSKQQEEQALEMPLIPRETVLTTGKQKIMSLLIDAQVEASVQSARDYLSTLKREQREMLNHLLTWLRDVLGEGA